MSRIFTRTDGAIMYEADKTHRAAYKLDPSKGLALDDQSPPVTITAAYRVVGDGWAPFTPDYKLRAEWESDILKLESKS